MIIIITDIMAIMGDTMATIGEEEKRVKADKGG